MIMQMINKVNTVRANTTRSIGSRTSVVMRAAPSSQLSRYDLEQKRRAEARARQEAEDAVRRKKLASGNITPVHQAPRDSAVAPTWISSAVEVKNVGDKDLAAKIASLEKQIKDANSDARKAPLVAQLIALRSGSSYSASTPSSTFVPSSSASTSILEVKAEVKAWTAVADIARKFRLAAEEKIRRL